MPRRLRQEEGFGLVELVIAMSVLLIGILAIFGLFQAGIVQIGRASTISTAAALAEAEMENYRAIRYDAIGLDQADLDAISASDAYKTDSAYVEATLVLLPTCGTTPCTTSVPTETVTGPDGDQYRLDTYMNSQTVSGGRDVKVVTIVVRDADDLREWARVVSSFDESTGV
jgi:type II secretory pathway pseudopilin PulG